MGPHPQRSPFLATRSRQRGVIIVLLLLLSRSPLGVRPDEGRNSGSGSEKEASSINVASAKERTQWLVHGVMGTLRRSHGSQRARGRPLRNIALALRESLGTGLQEHSPGHLVPARFHWRSKPRPHRSIDLRFKHIDVNPLATHCVCRERFSSGKNPQHSPHPKRLTCQSRGCLGQGAVCGPWCDDKAVHRDGAGFKLRCRGWRRPVTGAKHHPFPALNPAPLGLDVRPLDKRSWRPSSQQLGGDVRGIEGLSGRRRKRSAASGFQQGCQLCRQTQPLRWRCRTGLSEMIPAMIQQGHDLSQA